MRLPDVRTAMMALAADIDAVGLTNQAQTLRQLAEHTRRRSPIKRAPPQARSMTPVLATEIRRVARQNPDWCNRQIGEACGVDGGRVSEVLAGRRQ